MKRKLVFALLVITLLLNGCGTQKDVDKETEYDEQIKTQEEGSEGKLECEIETQESEIEIEPESQRPEPADDELVLVVDYIPDIVIDLKYATTDNFTGQIIYENADAYLRYGTVKKLMLVQDALKPLGYKLLIWDAYRPVEAQFKLWEICPDSTYVANPNKGYSSHSKGNTVDITLVTLEGEEVSMPTEFDDFSVAADRDYSDVSKEAGENAQLLQDLMESAGFRGYSGEWWHYTDIVDYSVVDK